MTKPGIFCVSVDTHDTENSAGVSQRRHDVVELFQRMDVSSSWSSLAPQTLAMPIPFECSLVIPKDTSRGEVVHFLRRATAAMTKTGRQIHSMVIDPLEARKFWDVLVRKGCQVARPRSADACADTRMKVIRGGLWYAPMSCSFVGGSRRTVRTLFGVCQKRLVQTVQGGGLFHLNVELSNQRSSWPEELQALRALMQTARDLERKNRCRLVLLSQVASSGKSSQRRQVSILRAA